MQKGSGQGGSCNCDHAFGKKLLMILAGVLLVYGIVYLGAITRNASKQYFSIGKADKMERTITVSGIGKVNAENNLAVTTIGYNNTDKDIAKAQADNKKVMDQVIADLKQLGIESKDLESNYSVYPNYNYTEQRGQELVGYQVSNQLTVKIRDLSKVPNVLALAGKYGANQVSGLNFTVDEPENLKTEARVKALDDARAKAEVLSQKLGVSLGSVVSYNEYESGGAYPVMMKNVMSADSMSAPAVEGGSKDVMMNVNVTYEILP